MYTCPSSRELNHNLPPYRWLILALVIATGFWWATAESESRFTKYKLSSEITDTMTGFTVEDLANGSLTIKTTGRPVFIGLISSSTTTTSVHTEGRVRNDWVGGVIQCHINFDRDGSSISTQTFASQGTEDLYLPCSAFSHFDVPSAGSHTYKVRAWCGSSTNLVDVDHCKLLAYELP